MKREFIFILIISSFGLYLLFSPGIARGADYICDQAWVCNGTYEGKSAHDWCGLGQGSCTNQIFNFCEGKRAIHFECQKNWLFVCNCNPASGCYKDCPGDCQKGVCVAPPCPPGQKRPYNYCSQPTNEYAKAKCVSIDICGVDQCTEDKDCYKCGNIGCEPGECAAGCKQDCSFVLCCGNGVCDPAMGENNINCSTDCGGNCGNNKCDPSDCSNCSTDCTASECCGNGVCDLVMGENNVNCPKDCGGDCGNNKCDSGECKNCPGDCEVSDCCGNGACDAGVGENKNNCGDDCKDGNDGNGNGNGGAVIEPPIIHKTFEELIEAIINILFVIALIVAPLLMIIAGFLLLTAAGDVKKADQAKKMIFYAAIGLAIVLMSYGIIAAIKSILGVETGT